MHKTQGPAPPFPPPCPPPHSRPPPPAPTVPKPPVGRRRLPRPPVVVKDEEHARVPGRPSSIHGGDDGDDRDASDGDSAGGRYVRVAGRPSSIRGDVLQEPEDDNAIHSDYGVQDHDSARASFDRLQRRYHNGPQFSSATGHQGAKGFGRGKYDAAGECHFASSSRGAAERRKIARAVKQAEEEVGIASRPPPPPAPVRPVMHSSSSSSRASQVPPPPPSAAPSQALPSFRYSLH